MSTYRNLRIPLVYQLKDSDIRVERWRLRWIGGNFFEGGRMYSVFYFKADTLKAPDHTADVSACFEVTLESYMQSYFCIGCVFGRAGQLISKPEFDAYYQNYSIEINGCLNPRSGFEIQEILEDLPAAARASEMFYFEIQKTIAGREMNIIIPVLEICRYLYFNYPILAKYILDYKFNSILYAPKRNKTHGRITYDNKLAAYFEIEKIVQFIFMQENLGLKSINMIGAGIRFRRIADTKSGASNTYYPSTILPFKDNASMKFYGKQYLNDGKTYLFVNQIGEISPADIQEEVIGSLDIEAQFSSVQEYNSVLRKRKKTEDYAFTARQEKEFLAEQNAEDKRIKYFYSDTALLLYLSKKHVIDSTERVLKAAELADIAKRIRKGSLDEKNQRFVQRYSELILSLISEIFPVGFVKLQCFKLKENIHTVFYNNKSREVIIAEIETKKGYFYIINFASDFSVLVSNSMMLEKLSELDLRLVANKFVIDYLSNRDGNRAFLKYKKLEYKRKYRIAIHQFLVYKHKNEADLVLRAESDAHLILDKIMSLEENTHS